VTRITERFDQLAGKVSPRSLLALDAAGAFLTASVHGVVLPRFAGVLGIPAPVFGWLAIVAAAYCAYSSLVAFANPEWWVPAIRVIATGNALFVMATLALVVILRDRITGLGVAYVVFEAAVVLAIALFEWRYTLDSGRTGTPPAGARRDAGC